MKMNWNEKVLDFYHDLGLPEGLPSDVEVLYPFGDMEVKRVMRTFYQKYYADGRPRTFLIGVNPGRLGAGTTGIPFTDPVQLYHSTGIVNKLPARQELSSTFIYQMIKALGGTRRFYGHFYFTGACPVGFTRDKKNWNYYDMGDLPLVFEQYIVDALHKQVGFGARPAAFCLGKGKNFEYLQKLNDRHHFFESITPLPHPRWVMQYRLKKIKGVFEEYKFKLGPYF